MAKETPNQGSAEVRVGDLPPDPGAVVMSAKPLVTEASAGSETATKAPAEHTVDLKAVKTVKRAARVNGEPAEFELFHWQHAAAEALHGWKQHAHHEAKPIQLTRQDYEAALVAASQPVTRRIDPKTGELLKDGDKLAEPVNSHKAAEAGWPTITDYEPHAPALSIHKDKG